MGFCILFFPGFLLPRCEAVQGQQVYWKAQARVSVTRWYWPKLPPGPTKVGPGPPRIFMRVKLGIEDIFSNQIFPVILSTILLKSRLKESLSVETLSCVGVYSVYQ